MRVLQTVEAQPADVRGLLGAQRDRLIVAFINVDGNWQPLSHYGDDRWRLVDTTTNRPAASAVLNFSKFPEAFRGVMKAIIYRYIVRGRNGQVRPRSSSVSSFFLYARSFLRHLEELNIHRLGEVTPLVCKLYVDAAKMVFSKRSGQPIKATTLLLRFLAVEAIYELSQYADEPMPNEPWPGASAELLAGLRGDARVTRLAEGRTPLIPDDVFARIFQTAWREVLGADKLLGLRDGLDRIDAERLGQHAKTISDAKRRYLVQNNWEGGLTTFNPSLLSIRTACYIVVASLTGCRNHEIAFIQSDACYRAEDDEGETYWWMRSRSTKTGEGNTEWMAPEAVVTALRAMDRWAKPYQESIELEIVQRRAVDPSDPEIAECQRHRSAVFLSGTQTERVRVRTLTAGDWGSELKAFVARHGIDWKLNTHQFRRKFANYAARSQFGDLRYLRDHFKHWSMDMTLGYALNESQELSLFHEIQDELDSIKGGVVEQWFQPHEPLAGGYGQGIMNWRHGSDVTIFKDRSSMIKAISDSTAIRSNGHAWCTADDNLCVGYGGLETTRCVNCDNAVIGRAHARLYQGLYDQLKETLGCADIGEAGMARVRRDIGRCRDVLTTLGYEPVERSL
jgi:integrase